MTQDVGVIDVTFLDESGRKLGLQYMRVGPETNFAEPREPEALS